MNQETLSRLTAIAPGGKLLDENERERLTILQNDVDEDDWRGTSRGERLSRVQGDIHAIVAPALDRLASAALECAEGGAALASVTGNPVTDEDRQMLAAANQLLDLSSDLRTGHRIFEPQTVANLEGVLCE